MKKIVILTVLYFTFPGLNIAVYAQQDSVQATGIHFFHGTWQEAVARSVKENKMIFLDGYTVWCGPCKVLAKEIFTKKEVGDFYNAHFINVSMDMEKEGKPLERQYALSMFPALLYLKPGGFSVVTETGLKDAPGLMALAQKALVSKDSVTLDERFEKGGYADTAFLRMYFTYKIQYERPGMDRAALDKIVELQGMDALYQKKYWDLLGLAATGEPVGLYFAAHLSEFARIYGEDAVDSKLADMYLNIKMLCHYRETSRTDTTVYRQFMQRVKGRNLPAPDFFNAALHFYLACRDRQFDDAFQMANGALEHGKAWQYLEMAKLANWLVIGDKEGRLKAAVWAQKAMAMANDPLVQNESRRVAHDLSVESMASVIPTPEIYGINL